MKRLGAIFSVMFVLGSLLAASPAGADQVQVRTSQGDGYGRITFRWPQPVGHQAVRDGNRLVVNFSRPIQADLRPIMRGLGQLVTATEAAPNDATVVLRVRGDFSVRSYDSGSAVVVDIVSATKAETASKTETKTSGDGPTIGVRTGVHKDYTRIVFDWPSTTTFALVRSVDKATLQFSNPGQVNLNRLASGNIRNVKGAESSSQDGKLSVTLNVDATSEVKTSTSGPKVIVDVYPAGTQAAASAPATPSAPAAQAAQGGDQPPAPRPAPVAAVEQVAATPVVQPQAAETPPENTSAPLELKAPGQDTEQITGQAPEQAPVQTRAQASSIMEGVVALKFNWDEPVGAAVFRRAGDLWVVFDKRSTIDTQALLKDGAGLITAVEQVPSRNGAVLRMTTAESVNPDIKRAGLAWILEFAPQPLIPSAPLQADAQPDSPLGARVFVAVPEPGNIIAFRDPEVGDNLVVIPVIPLGHGVSRIWSYPQVQLLPSKQGVVIKPLSDDLRVRPLRQGVEITSTGTLQISSVSAEERANVELQQQLASSTGMGSLRPMTRVLDLEKWKRPDLQSFTKTKQDLQRDVAFAKNDRIKKQTQHDLAQFYFANGFEAESLGVLSEMVRVEPEYAADPEYLIMKGAASWMMGRLDDARTDLNNPNLDPYDEATFWRAAVVAEEGRLPDVAYELRKTGSITQPYPKSLKIPTALWVAQAAVELGDVKQAGQYLEVLNVDSPSRAQQDQIDYVSGKLKEVSGDFDGAIGDWERAMEGRHRPSRAKAAVARTELLLRQGHFTPKDAIEEYEKLRFVWRGDEFEFKLLHRLGTLYLEQQLYREGLRTLRQAATYFPENPDSNLITKQMSDAFNMLYMENGADVLPPVTAIALYDEFRELTPPGALGDQMIRRLADRLVGVDLLSRAADLLEAQIEFRLKGEEKARVGARLALIYLFDRQYDKAIESLNKTQVSKLPDALASQRVLLRAQAQIGLEQPQIALELLNPESSQEAEMIRSNVYWRAGDWKNASKSLNKMTQLMGIKPRKPLNEVQAAAVLSLAIANTLSGNEVAIVRLLDMYGPAMAKTSFADAFKLIAEPPETGLVDYRGLEPIVKNVENFQGFMEVYRQRVADGQLSSLY